MIKRTYSILIILIFVCSLVTNNCYAQLCFAFGDTIAKNYNPASIASADFNGDGKADLVTDNRNTNDVSIYLGTGTGHFGAPTNFNVGSNPQSLLTSDFNTDGKTDLAVVNQNSNSISILLGIGTGSFSAATNFTVGTTPGPIACADFNGDGIKDLAVGNFGSYNISLLPGTGTGGFGAATVVLDFSFSGHQPVSMISSDFNLDGKSDLAMTFYSVSNVYVSLGAGTGSFGAAIFFPVGSSPNVLSADFNLDGKADLATSNAGSSNVSVLLGAGTGSFSVATNYSVGVSNGGIVSADFNKDGFVDLAVNSAISPNLSILLGTGVGSFSSYTNYVVGVSEAICTADFNGDSMPDLGITSTNAYILLNCSPLGIKGFNDEQGFSVYPNPAANNITVGSNQLTENSQIQITDVLGNKVKSISTI
jgi:hypothetical protein